jgi:four helix bundle protein
MGQSFRDLTVWQRAVELATCIYQVTAQFPRSEIYGLTSQLRRAAVSVASNIAEGAGRGSKKEFKQFLQMARGSNGELQTQLIIASNLEIATRNQVASAEALSHEVGKMLNGLLRSISQPPGRRLRTDH